MVSRSGEGRKGERTKFKYRLDDGTKVSVRFRSPWKPCIQVHVHVPSSQCKGVYLVSKVI